MVSLGIYIVYTSLLLKYHCITKVYTFCFSGAFLLSLGNAGLAGKNFAKMGTRADFYIRKSNELTWMGSIAWDGYKIDNVAKSKTEERFISNLAEFLSNRDDATYPKDGWPWPWKNSKLTDEIWVFDCETNSIWRGYEDTGEYKDHTTPYLFSKGAKQLKYDEEKNDFIRPKKSLSLLMPDMSNIQNVQMGSKSGLLVIRG